MRTWLRKLGQAFHKKPGASKAAPRRLCLESLEDRTMLAANLTFQPIPFSAVEGSTVSGILAHFTNDDPAGSQAGDYSVLINWCDNTTSSGQVTANANGGFDVSG